MYTLFGKYVASMPGAISPSKRPDWYFCDRLSALQSLIGVPGVLKAVDEAKVFVHRSHVPLVLPQSYQLETPWFSAETNGLERIAKRGNVEVRDYQVEDVKYMLNRRGTLNANPMRSGKTVEALLTHALGSGNGKLLVTGPKAARYVWINWIKRLWPKWGVGTDIVYLAGKKYDRDKIQSAKAIFCHYDILRYWQSIGILDLDTLVVDEGHLLSNPSASRTQAVILYATQAKRVLCLTGTPVWNTPASLYSILQVVTPGAWGTPHEFGVRYCDGKPGTYGFVADGSSNEEEFQDRLREIMIRRTWESILPQLPAMTRAVEVIELTADQMFNLDKRATAIRESRNPAAYASAEWTAYRQLVGEYKAAKAMEMAARYTEAGERSVLWVWHRSVADLMTEEFGCPYINGDNSDKADEIISKWAADEPGPLIMSLAVGSAAIDLSAAPHSIFVEWDWTPATMGQAEMRTWTPHRPMTAEFLTTDHTADMAVAKTLLRKVSLASKMGVPAAESALDIIEEALDLSSGLDEIDETFLSDLFL